MRLLFVIMLLLLASCSTSKVSETPSTNTGSDKPNTKVREFPPATVSDGPLLVTKLTEPEHFQSVKITNKKQGRAVIQRVVFNDRENSPACESRLDSYYILDLPGTNDTVVHSHIPNDLRSKQMKDDMGQFSEATANLELGDSVRVFKRGKSCGDDILKVDVYSNIHKWTYSWIE